MASLSIISQMLPRSFSAADVVLSYEPWVWCLEWQEYEKICAWCLTESERLRCCSGCKVHRYCDARCQAADWKKEHKQQCAMLRGLRVPAQMAQAFDIPTGYNGFDIASSGFVMVLLMAKISGKLKNNDCDELAGLGKMSAAEILTSFPDTAPADSEGNSKLHETKWCGLFDGFSSVSDGCNRPTFADGFKIVWSNAIPILLPGAKDRMIGAALFPQIPKNAMTPVCLDSNVSMDFKGRVLAVRAVEDIPHYTGLKDLRYSEPRYNQLCFTRTERRSDFETTFRQSCSCRKCTPEYEAEMNPLKCATPDCPERIPADGRASHPCTQCGAVNTSRLQQFRHFMKKYVDIQKNSDDTSDAKTIRKKGALLKEIDAAGILHKDSHLRFLCGWMLASQLQVEKRYEEAWTLFRELAVSVRTHYPKYHPDRARYLAHAASAPVNLCELAVTEMNRMRTVRTVLADYPLWMGFCEEARDIYATLYGKDCKQTKQVEEVIADVVPLVAKLAVSDCF